MTDGSVEGRCPIDIEDIAELQEREEGQGDGGAAEAALSDLFKRGLSVPESTLERLVRVTGGEEDAEGGWSGRLSSSASWMFSWRAAWDRA